MARSLERDWAVCVISMEEGERTLCLPMAALGADRLPERDLFDLPLQGQRTEDGGLLLRIPPRSGLMFCAPLPCGTT